MTDIYPLLHKCSFFDNVLEEDFDEALQFLNANRKKFSKDSSVLNIGDNAHPSGFLIKGCLEISLLDENANQINVKHINENNVFGMAIACAQKPTSPVRLKAITDCDILFLDFKNVLNPSSDNCRYKNQIAANLLRDLARQTLFLNQKIRIIGQKKLRDKIKVFLQTIPHQKDGEIYINFNRNELADYLYVNRSALSRELSRMKNEGFIEYSGKYIKILDEKFFKC